MVKSTILWYEPLYEVDFLNKLQLARFVNFALLSRLTLFLIRFFIPLGPYVLQLYQIKLNSTKYDFTSHVVVLCNSSALLGKYISVYVV